MATRTLALLRNMQRSSYPALRAPALQIVRRSSVVAAANGEQQLDGAPLPKPRISRVAWEPNETFHSSDDPDRTASQHDWELPRFVTTVDPADRARQTVAEEIDVSNVKGHVPGFSFARAVDGVLTEAECSEVLRSLNMKGFTPALVNVGEGVQRYLPEYRSGYRVIQDSPPLADWLYEVLTPHLPPTMEGSLSQWGVPPTLSVSSINQRFRFLCYLPGQHFKPHADGGEMRRPRDDATDSASGAPTSARDLSMITIQLYLHDMHPAHGGATRFSEPPFSGGVASYQPRAGSVLLFTQELVHEGAMVNQSRKFTMRSEVMYSGFDLSFQSG